MKLELDNLSKAFDKSVLADFSLHDEVSTLAIIGRSGCGKSTLLRILGGLLPASSGSAMLNGVAVEDSVAYRKNIGFVFQQAGLFSHLNALENVILPLMEVHQLTKQAATTRAMELLERFGLESEVHKRPAQLSGGQKQRVAIARAVAPKPQVLLLDEPTSALDPEYTAEVLTVIHELRESNLSFVIATHEMGFARSACEKVLFMHEGRIGEYGDSHALFDAPQTPQLQAFLSKLLLWRM